MGGVAKTAALPLGACGAISVMYVSIALAETLLLPFAPRMVASFGVTHDDSELGYYAGLLASAFYFGMLLTSSAWGMVSDRIGRKPVLLLSLLATACCALLFGLSRSLLWAMTARFLSGLLSGVYPVGRTFSLLALNWGVGLLLGPALGGVLASPASKFPRLFPAGSLFAAFPFLLPYLLLTVLALVSFAAVLLLLPETLGQARALRSASGRGRSRERTAAAAIEDALKGDKGSLKEPLIPSDLACPILSVQSEATGGSVALAIDEQSPGEHQSISREHHDSFMPEQDSKKGTHPRRGQLGEALLEPDTLVSMLLFATLAFAWTSQNEVFALWALTDWQQGGLDFDTAAVGLSQAAGGLAIIPFQLFVYRPMAARLGPLQTLQVGVLAMMPLVFFPAIRMFPAGNVRVAAAMLVMVLRSMGISTAFTTCVVLVANSVHEPQLLGSINGVSQTLNTAFSTLAPTAGGSIYAWALGAQRPFPLDYHLYWIIWLLLCTLMLALSLLLSPHINQRKFEVHPLEDPGTDAAPEAGLC